MLVQGNIRRVKELGVVLRKSGRGLKITLHFITLRILIAGSNFKSGLKWGNLGQCGVLGIAYVHLMYVPQ